MLMASTVPAQARDPGRYGYGHGGYYNGYGYPSRYKPYRHYRHRDRGLDAGDVIGIAALIGAVAIIATSASKNKDAKSRDTDWRDRDGRYEDQRDDGRYDGAEADAAIDACAAAARDEAESQSGGYAEIRDVETPRRSRDGGWDVEGRLEQRASYSGNEMVTKSFSCSYERGGVAHVYVSRNFS